MSLNLNSKLKPDSAFGGIYRGKRVLVTGHTGFKGGWLAEWLLGLGAEVTGFALPPATQPSLFDQLGLASRLRHVVGDVRDLSAVRRVLEETKPDFVFHLAAQPLVRLSYDQPVETYATNIMGTVNVLEALRLYQAELKSQVEVESKGTNPDSGLKLKPATSSCGRVIAAVMITTDKCYENKEWVHSYREEDPMGGYDPYSSSKGAAELVIAAYRRSYFSSSSSAGSSSGVLPVVRVASARAGNVLGGGDWAMDRIVPDAIRALQSGQPIPVRNKVATRPWQHVLEPLSGYMHLASELAKTVQVASSSSSVGAAKTVQVSSSSLANAGNLNGELERLKALCGAFNFGPALTSNRTVVDLVQEILKHRPGRWEDKSDPKAVHEAKLLNLATDKAYHFLGWRPAWNFEQTLEKTITWYCQVEAHPASVDTVTLQHIADYQKAARELGLPWTI